MGLDFLHQILGGFAQHVRQVLEILGKSLNLRGLSFDQGERLTCGTEKKHKLLRKAKIQKERDTYQFFWNVLVSSSVLKLKLLKRAIFSIFKNNC